MAEEGTSVTNSGATTDVPSNYLICARTGFKIPVSDGLVRDGYGQWVRASSAEQRHPQDRIRSRGGEKQRGSVSPEQTNRFVGTEIDTVTADDL